MIHLKGISCNLVLFTSFIRSEETGNSLVNCAACQSLQAQINHWSCDVNCKVINSQNGKWLLFYPCLICLLTLTITEAFDLPKASLFSNYKVMLVLGHLRVNWIQIQVMWYLSSCWLVVNNHGYYYVTFWWKHILHRKCSVIRPSYDN